MKLLTFAIPYTAERQRDFDRLEFEIWKQIEEAGLQDRVNIISDSTGKEMTIGEKRNLLYAHPDSGEYQVQWDSDDWIHPQGVQLIEAALESKPDCVTYFEQISMNGVIGTCDHSLYYDKWEDNAQGYDFVRTPYFKDVIRTDIARCVPVPHQRWNEDEQWSIALLPHLKTQVHIDQEIYHYIYKSEGTDEERYGLNL